MSEKIYYPYHKYKEDMDSIVQYCDENKINHVFGVFRGSLIPAVEISNRLDIPMSIIKCQLRDGFDEEPSIMYLAKPPIGDRILVIDDIWDTGESIRKIKNMFSNFNYDIENIEYFTLFGNEGAGDECQYMWESNYKWIQFWWEKSE